MPENGAEKDKDEKDFVCARVVGRGIMKNKKTVHREYDTEIVESITCDICKRTYQGENWERKSSYDVLETEIKLRTGASYPEGGGGEETKFDICPTCFVEKLMPALREMGAEPAVRDWRW